MKWIKMVAMDDPILQIVLEHYIETVMACGERARHLNEKIALSIPGSKIEPAV